MATRASFTIGWRRIVAGARETINLPVSVLSDRTPVTMSVHVVHGRRPGPTMFVSAAVHGDEIIGVEIVRRLLRTASLDRLKGTLLAIPIVNSFGFMNHSRYLPHRRDLNRSFRAARRVRWRAGWRICSRRRLLSAVILELISIRRQFIAPTCRRSAFPPPSPILWNWHRPSGRPSS